VYKCGCWSLDIYFLNVWPITCEYSESTVCIDNPVTFGASSYVYNPDRCGLIWAWDLGRDAYDTGDGDSSSEHCRYSTSGDRTVTVTVTEASTEPPTCGCGDESDSYSRNIKVVEVASLLPDVGTEFDDGDGNPNTKSFVVCTADAGVVTVTATPNPSVGEQCLPGYPYGWGWQLEGGSGGSWLFRTVDRTWPGVTTITCTCGSSSKTTKIYVAKGDVHLWRYSACDGEQANVDLIVTPTDVKDLVTSVQFTATVPNGVTNFGNPSGQGLTFSQRGNIREWRINNARWYSNQSDHCNNSSDYEIKAQFTIKGVEVCPYSFPATFTVSASIPTCLNGWAKVMGDVFSGSPAYTTDFNEQTQLYETTVTQGTFVRNVQADSWWHVAGGTASQYYNMVSGEEQYHEQQQMENPSHVRWGTAFLVANIMNVVQAYQPYTASTQAQSLAFAVNAFESARYSEERRSWSYLGQWSVRCANESEAKTAVGSSHRVAMPCTYPSCP
jgi:hypothetical protein